MAVNRKEIEVEGVWGPYFSAMIPGLWLAEGGESATGNFCYIIIFFMIIYSLLSICCAKLYSLGALIDHVVFSHYASASVQEKAKHENISIYAKLNQIVFELKEKYLLKYI